MNVAFDRLGPGQSGRLAYQVLGSNGPINNPSGIRYLRPDDPLLQGAGVALNGGGGVPGLMMWNSAAQLASLGISAVNLAVSVAVLAEVRRVSRRLEHLTTMMRGATEALDRIETKLDRIDINVAEGNLRAGLRHVIASASGDGWLDLEVLQGSRRELDKFTESLAGFGYGLAPTVHLSGDVRAMVVAIRDAFRGVRLAVVQRHNLRVKGSPVAVVAEAAGPNLKDEQLAAAIATYLMIKSSVDDFGRELGDTVNANFFFAGKGASRRYRSLATETLGGRLRDTFLAMTPEAVAIASTIAPMLEADDTAGVDRIVREYLSEWWSTDARLLWDLASELEIHRDADYWAALDGWHDTTSVLTAEFDIGEVQTWVQDAEGRFAPSGTP